MKLPDNDLRAIFETIIMLAIILTIASALTSRIKRLEADVEDLRMRVIYGVKP